MKKRRNRVTLLFLVCMFTLLFPNQIIFAAAPLVPANVSASSTSTTVTITWSPVSGATSYTVNLVGDHRTVNSSTTSYTYSGLTPSTRYDYSVCANNTSGSSAFSSPQYISTISTASDIPTNVSATATSTTVTITWNAVAGATGYTVNLTGDHRDINSPSTTSFTYTNLPPSTHYDYSVSAKFVSGSSAFSAAQYISTLSAPTPTPTSSPISTPTSTPAPTSSLSSDDYGNSFSSAFNMGTLAAGENTRNGSIEVAGDCDFFKFTAPQTGSYTIKTTGTTDTMGQLYNNSQVAVGGEVDDVTGSINFSITASLTANTVYYLRVRGYTRQDGTSSVTGPYTLNITVPTAPPSNILVNPITLNSREGSLSGLSGSKRCDIAENIPAGKVVVLSLSGLSESNAAPFSLSLRNDNPSGISPSLYGGWYAGTKMSYFKTSDATNTRYYIQVNTTNSVTYTINVSVLDSTSFTKCDTKEQASSEKTYLISNSPEILNSNYYKGEWGYYLQRSTLQGNANIYWEHWNSYSSNMKFGVLLYNTNSSPVTVTLNRRSFSDSTSGTGALNDAWEDWLNKVVKPDESGAASTVTIPANGARWICIQNVPYRSWGVIFNGVVDISIPSGYSLFCDTYIMTPGTSSADGRTYVEITRASVASERCATPPSNDSLRGSGTGAMLISNEGSKTITPGNPYRLAITGFDMPDINTGEKISISDSLGTSMSNCCNFGVVYKFNLDGFTSTNTIKGQVKYNNKVNPNTSAGAYVIVQKKVGNTYYAPYKVYLNGSSGNVTGTFDSNVPQGTPVTYYVIANGMSNLPIEVCFTN